MSDKRRSAYADYLKGILMFGVVAAHMGGLTRQGGMPHGTILPSLYAMMAWSMPLFMAVAGWFFRYSVDRRSLGSLLGNKFQTLVVPTVFWRLVFTLLLSLLAYFGRPASQWDAICQWFLPSIIFCILLGTLCRYVGKFSCPALEYACAGLIAIGLHFIPGWTYNVAYMFPFFYCGYMCNRFNLAGKVPHWVFPLCLAAACVIWSYIDYAHHFKGWSHWYSGTYILGPLGWKRHLVLITYRNFLGLLGSIGFAGCLFQAYNILRTKLSLRGNRAFMVFCSFIKELGVWSLAVYLVQSVVVERLLSYGFACYISSGQSNPFDDCFLLYRWVLVPLMSLFMCWVILMIIRAIRRQPLLSRICTGK